MEYSNTQMEGLKGVILWGLYRAVHRVIKRAIQRVVWALPQQ